MIEHDPAPTRLPVESGSLLVLGDCLAALEALPAGSVDLVVADPPFGSGRRHATQGEPLCARHAARDGAASPVAFDDRWETLADYLAFLSPRLAAAHRVLAPTGSLVLHVDHHAGHHARLELDRIFGPRQFVNEIIWHYTGGGRSRQRFSRKHDTLYWYARGPAWHFDLDAARVPYQATSGFARAGIVARSGKRYRPHPRGTPLDDVWDIPIVNPLSRERCGYPTQKPEKLLERLITILSRPGDLVLDPFCGSGTTLVVAARAGRRWIGVDIASAAIDLAEHRLRAAGAGDLQRMSVAGRLDPGGESPLP